jgi:hypothetical protein
MCREGKNGLTRESVRDNRGGVTTFSSTAISFLRKQLGPEQSGPNCSRRIEVEIVYGGSPPLPWRPLWWRSGFNRSMHPRQTSWP